jgi:hypothetical protein
MRGAESPAPLRLAASVARVARCALFVVLLGLVLVLVLGFGGGDDALCTELGGGGGGVKIKKTQASSQ